jgi:uncharacterized repeat protein (TIGR03803 family)
MTHKMTDMDQRPERARRWLRRLPLYLRRVGAGLLGLTAAALFAQAARPVFTIIGSGDGYLAMGQSDIIYGTNSFLGPGQIYSLTPPTSPGGLWTQTTLYSFTGGSDGSGPAQLVVGPSAQGELPVLYGVTFAGGSANLGTVYSLTPPISPGGTWAETVLYNFTGNADSDSPCALVMAANGVLFGITEGYVSGSPSTVFSMTPPSEPAGSWTESVINTFSYTIMPGPPYDGLAIGSIPNWSHGLPILYGYGQTGSGTVYSLIPPATPGGAWTEKEIYAFTGLNGLGDGYGPSGAPAFGPHGTLYGTTLAGGNGGGDSGTVFSLTPPATPGAAWTETVLYNFKPEGGTEPLTGVVVSPSGVVYGNTYDTQIGYGRGTVFALAPPATPGEPWSQYTIHAFIPPDGGNPITPMILRGGVLYGSTNAEFPVFSLVP